MRTEDFSNWLSSLTDGEYKEVVAEYGEENLRIAYNEMMETLADDFIKESKENYDKK